MKLIRIYECLCDETRLRILHLLNVTPLCVSHLQKILELPQVKISKHLTYLKDRRMVDATRCENYMLYALSNESSSELESNLKCLQDCVQEYSVFKNDHARLQTILPEIQEILTKFQQARK